MLFSFTYNKQILEIDADSVVDAIIDIMDCDFFIENDKIDFEISGMKDAS